MPNWEMWPIEWADGAFVLHNWINTLYIPPLQTPGLPAEAARASWPDDARIQPGLNILIGPETTTYDFAWYHCGASTPITFPEGIQADLYVRRGGVSDSITATVALGGGGVSTSLYSYTTTLKSFRATFCDNLPWHTDIAGDLDLPWPADVVVPLTDMRLDAKGCVASSAVREAPLTLGYWQTTLHPTAAEFRPHDAPPPTHLLWLLGKVDVPHLSTSPTVGSELEPIPLETSLMPDGTFNAFHLVYDQAHYGFDGFDFLLSEVRLNDWTRTAVEPPEWQAAATLAKPPLCGDDPFDRGSRGFVALAGNLVVPYFGTLEGPSTARPELRVLGWDDYVGFTERPKAKRVWDLLVAEHPYDFDLVYAHHHTLHTGIFVDFRQDDFTVVNFDSAAVVSPTQTGIYLGLSSGTAALRALAETTITPLPAALEDPLRSTMVQQWVPKIWNNPSLGEKYVAVLEQIWDDAYHFTATTAQINGLGEDIPDEPEGGRTADCLHLVRGPQPEEEPMDRAHRSPELRDQPQRRLHPLRQEHRHSGGRLRRGQWRCHPVAESGAKTPGRRRDLVRSELRSDGDQAGRSGLRRRGGHRLPGRVGGRRLRWGAVGWGVPGRRRDAECDARGDGLCRSAG
ncbi:MAG TPA: hypothetical protein ENN19_12025 [Chloroflexi bacterium]|nr:hypothetical protein [Chloroflexota bacterium]